MLYPDSLTREELRELIPMRLPESAILGAKATVARRKADKAKAEWRKLSEHALRLTKIARAHATSSKFSGPAFSQALSAAHAQHRVSQTYELIWRRHERDAQYWERMAARARRDERRAS